MAINELITTRLPAEAAAKLRLLENRRGDAAAISDGAYERLRELSKDVERARVEVTQLQAADHRGELVRETRGEWYPQKAAAGIVERQSRVIVRDENRLARATEKFERAKQTLSEQQARLSQVSERSATLAALIEEVTDWVQRLPDVAVIKTVKVSPPKMKKGETTAEALDKVRTEILDMRAAIEDTVSAPIASGEAKERARQIVEQMATQGRPQVLDLVEGGRNIRWGTVRADCSGPHPHSLGAAFIPDSLGAMAWLLRDAMIKTIEAEIDELADDDNALTDDERADTIASLKSKILASQRHEEALVEVGEGQGLNIQRRADADVRAVLQIQGPEPR